ncbi:MAG: glycosyltransferase [Xanthobacteraceae bacterium]
MVRRTRAFPRAIGPQLLRWRIAAPIAALDHEDIPVINRSNFFLLDRCTVYFKRELPPDRWRLFLKTGHANLPTPRFRHNDGYRAWLDKLRPISLGLPLATPEPFPVGCADKTTDLFFAGRTDASSSVRQRGLAELKALREQGIIVDIAEAPLPRSEFYRRCAQARLTWSPEGLGWDCFRHYEAAACGSVPLMNQPTIERHEPLLQGVHAVYYDIERGALTRAVHEALAEKPRLEAMGRAAREHVLTHHTPTAIARHIVRTALERSRHGFPGNAGGNRVFTGARR